MQERGAFTRFMAIAGTVLVWCPLVAPILLTVVVLITRRVFLFDYLMPAELFPAALAGGLLLIWAALRARVRWALIGSGLVIATVVIVGGQALAEVTGVASGETEMVRAWWAVAFALVGLVWLALAAVGVGALRLLRDLSVPPQ